MRRRAHGFTLLETLVALAVTSVVLTALATAVPAALRASETARARLDQATAARAFLLHIERELASALAEPFTVGAEPATRPRVHRWQRARRTTRVRARARRRRATLVAALHGARSAGVRRARARRRRGATLDAYDGREWLATWSASRPPEAVRVRLRFADGETASGVAVVPIARRRTP